MDSLSLPNSKVRLFKKVAHRHFQRVGIILALVVSMLNMVTTPPIVVQAAACDTFTITSITARGAGPSAGVQILYRDKGGGSQVPLNGNYVGYAVTNNSTGAC